MSDDFDAKLANIEQSLMANKKRLAEIALLRQHHAVQAVLDNDDNAGEAIAKLDSEEVALVAETKTLNAATERIHALEREAQAEIQQRDLERRQHEFKEGAISVLATSTEIDQALNALVSLCRKRDALLDTLVKTGIGQSSYLQRLRSKGCLTAAASEAQVQNYFELGYTGPQQKRTLAESCNGLMQAKTAPPTPTASKRFKPQPDDVATPNAALKRTMYVG